VGISKKNKKFIARTKKLTQKLIVLVLLLFLHRGDDGSDSSILLLRVTTLLLIFANADQDMTVRRALLDSRVLKGLFVCLFVCLFFIVFQCCELTTSFPFSFGNCAEIKNGLLPPLADETIALNLMKCVKILSMDPNCLLALQEAGMVTMMGRCLEHYIKKPESKVRLGPLFDSSIRASFLLFFSFRLLSLINLYRRIGLTVMECAQEPQNQILNTLFHLCKINRARQEEAALAGVVPHLQHYIATNSSLKQVHLLFSFYFCFAFHFPSLISCSTKFNRTNSLVHALLNFGHPIFFFAYILSH
jgi:hypothetical protein